MCEHMVKAMLRENCLVMAHNGLEHRNRNQDLSLITLGAVEAEK